MLALPAVKHDNRRQCYHLLRQCSGTSDIAHGPAAVARYSSLFSSCHRANSVGILLEMCCILITFMWEY